MSSNHHQSYSDPNYLIRLQNLQINEDAAIQNSSLQRTHSLNSNVEPNYTPPLNRPQYIDSTKYVVAPNLTFVRRSDDIPGAYITQRNGHIGPPQTVSVYENLDNVRPSYAMATSQYSVGPGTYEVIGKKIDIRPNTNAGLRQFTHTPDIAEPTPIYENLSHSNASAIPPPLLPKKASQIHNNADISGMYVQPQMILSQIQRSQATTNSLPNKPVVQTTPRTSKV